MADPAKSVSQLAAEIEAKSRPRLAKCDPSEPRRSQCEERAAACYRAATKAMGHEWSVRRAAHDIERSVRMHLDYQSGSRSIPVDVVALLPEPAQVAFLSEYVRGLSRAARLDIAKACIAELPEEGEETARVA